MRRFALVLGVLMLGTGTSSALDQPGVTFMGQSYSSCLSKVVDSKTHSLTCEPAYIRIIDWDRSQTITCYASPIITYDFPNYNISQILHVRSADIKGTCYFVNSKLPTVSHEIASSSSEREAQSKRSEGTITWVYDKQAQKVLVCVSAIISLYEPACGEAPRR